MDTIKLSDLFYNNVLELPIWVKQVLHKRTKEDLDSTLQKYFEVLNPEGLVQEIKPELTYKGKKALEASAQDLTQEDIIFLNNAAAGYSIFDIALTNFWSLEICSKILVKLVKTEYIKSLESNINANLVEFLAGTIKTGDVLKRLGFVNVIQIEEALQEQKELKKNGMNSRIADIMIKQGAITNDDVEILLKLKEDAKKHFIMSLGLTTIKVDDEEIRKDVLYKLQREFKRLIQENNVLRSRLKKLLNIRK